MNLGPYELLACVGRGGMGAVYRARHGDTGEVVAVKQMAAEWANDPLLLRRFEQEFTAARRLIHPNIVRALGYGVEAGRPYLVMEYVEGQDLGQRVREQGPLPEAEAVQLISQIALGLHFAHSNNFIHRDVKPENVLLAADGRAQLTDLGLSKDLDAGVSLTRSRACLGTIVFIAPEQFEDARHAEVRSDVYGLAATLYFALTGVAPFQGRGNLTVVRKKLANDFIPPGRRLPTLGRSIDAAICQALDADPQRRPASCAEFAAALAQAGVAEVPSADELAERRAAPRRPAALKVACQAITGDALPWPAEILDISRTGARMELQRRFEPGTILTLAVDDRQGAPALTLLMRVRWARDTGSGRWQIGGAFGRPLGDDDLNHLAESRPVTVFASSASLL